MGAICTEESRCGTLVQFLLNLTLKVPEGHIEPWIDDTYCRRRIEIWRQVLRLTDKLN